jgi:hypothetical protein
LDSGVVVLQLQWARLGLMMGGDDKLNKSMWYKASCAKRVQ